MRLLARQDRDRPQPARFLVLGAILGGAIGCVTGLVLGLIAYPPTAWFAVFEVGIPGVLAGAVLGGIADLVARLIHLVKQP